jgi:hypothetical protein
MASRIEQPTEVSSWNAFIDTALDNALLSTLVIKKACAYFAIRVSAGAASAEEAVFKATASGRLVAITVRHF